MVINGVTSHKTLVIIGVISHKLWLIGVISHSVLVIVGRSSYEAFVNWYYMRFIV